MPSHTGLILHNSFMAFSCPRHALEPSAWCEPRGQDPKVVAHRSRRGPSKSRQRLFAWMVDVIARLPDGFSVSGTTAAVDDVQVSGSAIGPDIVCCPSTARPAGPSGSGWCASRDRTSDRTSTTARGLECNPAYRPEERSMAAASSEARGVSLSTPRNRPRRPSPVFCVAR